MKRIILSFAFLSAPLWGSGITNPSTFTGGTITTPIEAASGSTGAPSYSFSSSTQTGNYYTVNGGTHTYVMTVDGKIVGYWQLQNGTDGGHQNPEGYRPILWIGPGIISSTYTQLGEGLNVWGDTDGGGGQPQIDIVANNIGKGDARVLAQASLADTPNTVIGYLAAYGSGHSGQYWTGGPNYAYSVAHISQAPMLNMFQATTSSTTIFWTANATHGSYAGYHGANPTLATPDWVLLDNTLAFSSGGGVLGTTTNDAAGSTAEVGYSTSSVTPGAGNAFPTSTQWGDMNQVTLPSGGDYMCGAQIVADGSSASNFRLAISTHTGNDTTGMVDGDNRMYGGSLSTADWSLTITDYRISVTASTTVYEKYFATYSVSATAWGRLTCRRIR